VEENHPMKAILASAALALVLSVSAGAQETPVSYTKDIVPLFKKTCAECHNTKKAKGKLDMSTYALLKKGGKKGTPWKEGDPDKSLLVEVVKGPMPEMPEDGDPLTDQQVALIARWIKEGAKDDGGGK
jgi:mono/diheme cytochrome c family protein